MTTTPYNPPPDYHFKIVIIPLPIFSNKWKSDKKTEVFKITVGTEIVSQKSWEKQKK